MTDGDRARKIEELTSLANEIKNLKELYRRRRPIVIEFSGSPKSGKTSCINSLHQFLKRNGFSVEIIQERASICPVSDKQSPLFNLWTISSTISGLLGILESSKNQCDFVILDRGIFDSLCWFEWLWYQNRMAIEMKSVSENFLLQTELVGRIDIVFSFTSSSEKSIEREYATLLTNELGSIMNPTVLAQYSDAVKTVIREKSQFFHNIISMDTTDMIQSQVAMDVTVQALNALKSLLNEQIGYIETSSELISILESKSSKRITTYLEDLTMNFDARFKVENNIALIQPIPIAVLTDKNCSKVLLVKKKTDSVSLNSPEKNKLLTYVGGHIRNEDFSNGQKNNFLKVCSKALKREVHEELGIYIDVERIEPIFIYSQDMHKSRQHLAVCYLVQIDFEITKFKLDSKELQTSIKSRSGAIESISSLVSCRDFDSWSKLILNNFFSLNLEIETNMQLHITDLVRS